MIRDCMPAVPAGRDMAPPEREDGIEFCWILLPGVLAMFLALCKVSAWASEEFHLASPDGGGRGGWERALDAGALPRPGPGGAAPTAIDRIASANAAWLDGILLSMEDGLIACSMHAHGALPGLGFSRDIGGGAGVSPEMPISGSGSEAIQAYFDVQLLIRTLCEWHLLAMP